MPDTDAQERSLTGHEARWERHNSARQTRIVESAVALLDESAPGTEIPVQSIAKRAGLAKSVVYRQFEGREDLDRRIRSYLLEDFDTTISSQLDVNSGSIIDIATRTIRAVLDWMTDYPHRYEFMRSGATDDDPAVDAISTVKVRMEQRVRGVLIPITEMLGIDYSPFESVTYAVVTMVEEACRGGYEKPSRSALAPRSSRISRTTSGMSWTERGARSACPLTRRPSS